MHNRSRMRFTCAKRQRTDKISKNELNFNDLQFDRFVPVYYVAGKCEILDLYDMDVASFSAHIDPLGLQR